MSPDVDCLGLTEYLSLTEVAKYCPGGSTSDTSDKKRKRKRPHPASVWRWCRYGILARNGNRIRLRHYRVGGKIFTKMTDLTEFFSAIAQADAKHFELAPATPRPVVLKGQIRTTNDEANAIEQATAVLRADGFYPTTKTK